MKIYHFHQKQRKSEKSCLSVVFHIRAIKQALNHGIILKSVHRVFQFNQKAWLKPYIGMNAKLDKEAKNEFEKDFFKLMKNSVFGKTMENVRKHSDIKLLTTKEKRSKLVSESNYHTTKHFSENLLATEMKTTKVIMNKPVYLGMSILDISKKLMYEFWYDCIKRKYGDRAKLCYMDADSFVIYIGTEDFSKILLMILMVLIHLTLMIMMKDQLLIGKNKKVIVFFKDELGGKIIVEFCGFRANMYAYLIDGYDDDDDDYDKEK